MLALWRRPAANDVPEDVSYMPLSELMVAAQGDTGIPLSKYVFEEIARPAGSPYAFRGSVAFCVGDSWVADSWVRFECDGGPLATCSFSDQVPDADACIRYRDELTFAALMDDTLNPAKAVALGKLRVRGSLKIATASEELFVAAEARMRSRYGNVTLVGLEDAARAREAAELAQAASRQARLAVAAERSVLNRMLLRHLGTDQQIGAALLTVGSALYSGYCALALSLNWPADGLVNALYLASSLLWLVGSTALIHSSYPERVLGIATTASADAIDPSRLSSMSWYSRYVGGSSLLLGAWGLGLGAPTFLAGALLQTAHSGGTTIVPILYDLAGVYLLVATGLLVLGSLPDSLAANEGKGSTYMQVALGGSPFWQTHAANDLLAGTLKIAISVLPLTELQPCVRPLLQLVLASFQLWQQQPGTLHTVTAGTLFFTAFMVVCLLFGLIDLLEEPSVLTACFAVSQLPFAAGALLLARGTYPDMINRATFWGTEGDELVLDEAMLRRLIDST